MPRPHPETNKNQHQRFARHIGSPRRGASMNCSKWNAIFYERDCPWNKTYKGFRFFFCPIFVTLF